MRWNNLKKDILFLGFLLLFLFVLIKGTKFESKEEYYLAHIDDITADSETVTLSIRCDTILDNYEDLKDNLKNEKYVPENGVILQKTEYVLRKGDTAFTILQRAVRHEQIPMEFQGADENIYHSVYIQGINHLYEFSCGPLSGWMYRVNGEFPGYGCSRYELKDGDYVEYVYSCDLGRDIGGYVNE